MDSLYLVCNGVPFDVAFSLPSEERLQWVVVVGTILGQDFDWQTRQWRQVQEDHRGNAR